MTQFQLPGKMLKSALIIFAAVLLSGYAHKNILTINEMGNTKSGNL